MSEQQLEHWKHMGVLYKNPSCTCHLYEYENLTYRVFCIAQEQLQRPLIALCMEYDLSYSFYQGSFCLIQPYKDAASLSAWLQESHTIEERIVLCRNLVFACMREQLPQRLLDLTLDIYSIGVTSTLDIELFLNPNFSHLQHPLHTTAVCTTSKLLVSILSQGKETRHLHRYQQPEKYLKFVEKAEHRDYHDYAQLMNDLYDMENAFIRKSYNWSLLIRISSIILAGIGILVLCGIGIYKYMEWSERTYDGLQRIGEERMDP